MNVAQVPSKLKEFNSPGLKDTPIKPGEKRARKQVMQFDPDADLTPTTKSVRKKKRPNLTKKKKIATSLIRSHKGVQGGSEELDADGLNRVFSPENTQSRAARGGSKGLGATAMMGSAEGGPGKHTVVYNFNINFNLAQLPN